MEYQESFRLPNNNIGREGERKDERQTITLLKKKEALSECPTAVYSSGRLPNNFFACEAKKMAEIDSLATCESFLSRPLSGVLRC